jgi:calcineurin-like phosphoesterase family protein
MKYYTSDLHFGDDRLNLFGRELVAKTSKDIDHLIVKNWNDTITEKDTVYVLGDVAYVESGLKTISKEVLKREIKVNQQVFYLSCFKSHNINSYCCR